MVIMIIIFMSVHRHQPFRTIAHITTLVKHHHVNCGHATLAQAFAHPRYRTPGRRRTVPSAWCEAFGSLNALAEQCTGMKKDLELQGLEGCGTITGLR